MNKFLLGLCLGVAVLIASNVIANNLPTKYAQSSTDVSAVVLYAYTAQNVLKPVLVDASGSLLVNQSN